MILLFHDQTIAILTGFIFGSLCILWPWKTEITKTFGEKIKVVGYTYALPEPNIETVIALALMLLGIGAIAWIETLAGQKENN